MKDEFSITLFLSGDVMTGRGIDQVLPFPSDPILYERGSQDARDYVKLAERKNGAILKPVNFFYPWGDAVEVLSQLKADVGITNLETSVTTSNEYWAGKSVLYRMHPKNVGCISAAGIDCCCLANNHMLDWGYGGLEESLNTLDKAKIKHTGAGMSEQEAAYPAIIEIPGKGRVVVFSYGMASSGIPLNWAATVDKPGVNFLKDLTSRSVLKVRESIEPVRQKNDIIVFSVHWGGNWGYDIPAERINFAHRLVDEAGVNIIHGHSSHHVQGIEVYKDKLIIYGAGDFINDYEGIDGYENYRDDLSLMYFVSLNGSVLNKLQITSFQIKHFKLNHATSSDREWLKEILNREGKQFGTRVSMTKDGSLMLDWGG